MMNCGKGEGDITRECRLEREKRGGRQGAGDDGGCLTESKENERKIGRMKKRKNAVSREKNECMLVKI